MKAAASGDAGSWDEVGGRDAEFTSGRGAAYNERAAEVAELTEHPDGIGTEQVLPKSTINADEVDGLD
jgi:hypothetical protein